MQSRVSAITLGVASVPRARSFYERLGWRAHPSSDDNIAFFQAGSLIVGLYGRAALAEDAQVPLGRGFGGITLAYLVDEPTEVSSMLSAAEAAGGRIVKPAQDVFWGGHSGYFADLDGHLWEVAWNPHWTLRSDGSVSLP